MALIYLLELPEEMTMAVTKIIDRGWNRLKKEFKKYAGAFTKVGFPGETDKSHPEGTGNLTIAGLAAVHEFGRKDGTIPARPFQRQTFDRNLRGLLKLREVLYTRVLTGKITAKQALSQMGEWYIKRMKQTINKQDFEALKGSTIAARAGKSGGAKILKDTQIMFNSITQKVKGI